MPDTATGADRIASELQMTAWTRFAATGDPNGAGVPAWPAFADRFLSGDETDYQRAVTRFAEEAA